MDNSTNSQAPAEPTTPVEAAIAPEVPNAEVTTEPAAEADNPSTNDGSAADEPAAAPSAPAADAPAEPVQAPEAPAQPELGGRTDTTQGNVAPDPTVTVAPVASAVPEVLAQQAVANNVPVPGKVLVQKLENELEDELDSGVHASIDDFVKAHWEAGDANVMRMSKVLRMSTEEVWQVIKDLGYKLPQGL